MNKQLNSEIASDRVNGLELSSSQQRLLECLKSLQTHNYPFDKWYLGVLYALQNPMNPERFSQAAQTMRELLEKLPRAVKELDLVEKTKTNFVQLRSTLASKYDQAKAGYPDGWLGKQIDEPLDFSLQELDKYINASQNGKPSRSQQMKALVDHSAKNDPLFKPNEDLFIEQRKNRIKDIWKFFERVVHHGTFSEADFRTILHNCENELLSLFETSPSVDLNRLSEIIQNDITVQNAEECIRLLLKSGANRLFFFQKTENPGWIDHLEKSSLFHGIEDVEELEGNQIRANYWMPANYLRRAAKVDPQRVIALIQRLPTTNNPRVLEEFCWIAYELPKLEDSLSLKHRVYAYCKAPFLWFNTEVLSSLFIKWCSSVSSRKSAFRILNALSYSEESWEYQEFLKNGVEKAIEICPKETFSSLVNLLDSVLNIEYKGDVNTETPLFDLSEYWCPSLQVEDEYEHSSKALITRQLYKTGLQLCAANPQLQSTVAEQLWAKKWHIFFRIRWSIQTELLHIWDVLEISKEFVFDKAVYGKNEYVPEFALLLKRSVAAHGKLLFPDNSHQEIINAILAGPEKEHYEKRRGDLFSEDKYLLHKRYVHRQMLAPFEPILNAETNGYFRELISDHELGPFKDAEEAPKRRMAGFVTTRSPKSKEELQEFNDADLLNLINEWESEHHDPDDWLVEYTISELSLEFKALLRESIFTNSSRWDFWKGKVSAIERPVYIERILGAGQETCAKGDYSILPDLFDICEWSLTHKEPVDSFENSGSSLSRTKPNWNSIRRCVLTLIESLVKDDSGCSISFRPKITAMLSTLCSDFDSGLDLESKHQSNDVFSTAINRTRSRAIACVVQSCFWVRKQFPTDALDDLLGILNNRLQSNLAMTHPEFSIFGSEIHRLWNLSKDWMQNSVETIFPTHTFNNWIASFGTYLRHFSSNGIMFGLLQTSYQYAVHNTDRLLELNSGKERVKKLGQHLIRQFILGAFPLTGSDLLSQYYIQIKHQPDICSEIFAHVGWGLRNSKLDEAVEARIKEFFRWTIDRNASDCIDFSQWLDAECLDLTWRLAGFKEILTKNRTLTKGIHRDVKFLRNHVEGNELLVYECLELISINAVPDDRFRFKEDDVKFIIESSLKSANDQVKSRASRTLDIFLSKGFLDLNAIHVPQRGG